MRLNPCRWCAKRNRAASGWEQQTLGGEWARLCTICARRRLANHWNALLHMRKVALRTP